MQSCVSHVTHNMDCFLIMSLPSEQKALPCMAERRARRECSNTGNHSNNTWPDSVKVFLQIQMIIPVEIRTSSRCVVDIQKALGLTLIQKTKLNQQEIFLRQLFFFLFLIYFIYIISPGCVRKTGVEMETRKYCLEIQECRLQTPLCEYNRGQQRCLKEMQDRDVAIFQRLLLKSIKFNLQKFQCLFNTRCHNFHARRVSSI